MEGQQERFIEAKVQATYSTFGNLSHKTKAVWLVCHGYGQLAKHFIRRFDILDPEEHFVVAPQGLSTFYLNNDYNKVGASWLTKENREKGLADQLNFVEQVFEKEFAGINLSSLKLNYLGFSQGVATISRFAALKRPLFDNMVLWAGGLPKELEAEDFGRFKPNGQIHLVIGKQDEFYDHIALEAIEQKISRLYHQPKLTLFNGVHEVKRAVLRQITEGFV